MLLEPAPIDPRPGRTRIQAVAAAGTAVVALAAVIAIGVLGPKAPAEPTLHPLPSVAATPGPAASNAPAPSSVSAAPSIADSLQGASEASRFGLDPATVGAVLQAQAHGSDDGRLVIVAGWLSIRPGSMDCLPNATSSAAACWQEGILSADQASVLRWDGGRAVEVDAAGPRLRSILPPGLSLPPPEGTDVVGSPPLAGLLPARRVVLFGHFGTSSTDACRHGFLDCSVPFLVERIVSVDEPREPRTRDAPDR